MKMLPTPDFAKRGVALGDDANGLAVDDVEGEHVDGARGIGTLLEVHVGVAEGTAGDEVAADADGHHRTDGGEELCRAAPRCIAVEVTAVEARRGEAGGGRGRSGGSGGSGHLPGFFFLVFFWVVRVTRACTGGIERDGAPSFGIFLVPRENSGSQEPEFLANAPGPARFRLTKS